MQTIRFLRKTTFPNLWQFRRIKICKTNHKKISLEPNSVLHSLFYDLVEIHYSKLISQIMSLLIIVYSLNISQNFLHMNVKLFTSGHTFLDNPHGISQIQKVNLCQYSFPYMFHAVPVVRVRSTGQLIHFIFIKVAEHFSDSCLCV